MKVICNNCKQEVEVPMYFYDERLTTTRSHLQLIGEYEASINGMAICPFCGNTIRETFHSMISKEDIIRLATNGR
jgi:hypothetical protein